MAQYCPPYSHIHRDQSNLQYRGELLDDYVYNVDHELINPNLPRPGSRYRFLRLHCYRVPTHDVGRRLYQETRFRKIRHRKEICGRHYPSYGRRMTVWRERIFQRTRIHEAFIFRPGLCRSICIFPRHPTFRRPTANKFDAKTDLGFIRRNILFRAIEFDI